MSGSDELLARLGSEEGAIQRPACTEALERVRRESDLRRAIRELLRSGTPRARFAAAWVLFRSEPPGLRVLPALLDSLELSDGDLRWSAAHMLTALGRTQPEVLAVLLEEAADRGRAPQRRRMLLYALRELGSDRPETGAVLLAALDDPVAEVRRAALSSFVKLDEPPRACLERALEIARADGDVKLRRIAATVLPALAAHHADLRDAASQQLGELQAETDPLLARAARSAADRMAGS